MDRPELVSDALAISGRWRDELDLAALVSARIADARLLDANVDVVAVGKSSREMIAALASVPNVTIGRRLAICESASVSADGVGPISSMSPEIDPGVIVAEHPVPGPGSARAGRRVLEFLEEPTSADCTIFLISGGASSLCVALPPSLTIGDLHALWDAAVSTGTDITTLNQLRASISLVSGGAVLAHVSTPRSLSLVLVDNVVSGVRWVASGFTFPYDPDVEEVASLLALVGLAGTSLGDRLSDGAAQRRRAMKPPASRHENFVVGEPVMLLEATVAEARRRGYRVINQGARVQGDVEDVVSEWYEVLERERGDGPVCVVGVGEITVRVTGVGRGGRCQEFVWRLAERLARSATGAVALARASDGRDFLEGVAGAWSDETTMSRAAAAGVDWRFVADSHDTYPALHALDQLIEGTHTGWNLCDVYLALS